MSKSKKEDKIRRTKGMYPVKCILTEHEVKEAGFRLAGYYQEIETIGLEKKSVLAKFKQQLDEIKDKIHKTSLMIKQQIETRQVECEMTMDYNDNTVILRRLDTNEVVDKRGMTSEERQMKLFTGQEQKGKSAKSMGDKVEQEELKFEQDKQAKQNKKD